MLRFSSSKFQLAVRAIQTQSYEELILLLLKHPKIILEKDEEDNSLMHHAAKCDDESVIDILSIYSSGSEERDKLILCPNKKGCTPLHYARSSRRNILLSLSSDLSSWDDYIS